MKFGIQLFFKIEYLFSFLLQIEKYVTPESFAHVFCDDLGLAPSYREQISTSIRVQIEELTGVAEVPLSTDEQIVESMESDLRVIINVSHFCCYHV